MNLLKVKVVYIKSVPGYSKMTGMLSRLFIGAISDSILKDNDFVYTSDSDLIPFRKEYYQVNDYDAIVLLDAFRFGKFRYKKTFYSMYSLQYIGMTKCRWRNVMKLNEAQLKLNGESILRLVKNYYGKYNVKKNGYILRGDSTWWMDQKLVSIHIDNYLRDLTENESKQQHQQNVISKRYDGNKLDRIYTEKKWLDMFQNDYKSIIDSHLFHENYLEKINFIFLIISQQLDKNNIVILKKYVQEFIQIKNKTK